MQYYSLLIAAYAIWHFVVVCSINNLFFSSFVNSVWQFNYFLVKYLSVCFFSFFLSVCYLYGEWRCIYIMRVWCWIGQIVSYGGVYGVCMVSMVSLVIFYGDDNACCRTTLTGRLAVLSYTLQLTSPNFTKFSIDVTCCRDTFVLRRQRNTAHSDCCFFAPCTNILTNLCTSGFFA